MNGYQIIYDAVRTAAAEHQVRHQYTTTHQQLRHKTQRTRFALLRKATTATINYIHHRSAHREVFNQDHSQRVDKRYT